MKLNERIACFAKLGDWLDDSDIRNGLINTAEERNSWFTQENTALALSGIRKWLTKPVLENWVSDYKLNEDNATGKTVGLVMAGNIPLVGFHDILSVLISGNRLRLKMSGQDNFLPNALLNRLFEINASWKDCITVQEQMNGIDAVIATGSNNTTRYFEYYFRNIPALLRKNRTSVAVINGNENSSELKNLGADLFTYFGLGCRNVSHLFLPVGYNLNQLIENLMDYHRLIDHHKYANCYIYQRALLLIDQQKFTDTGYCVFIESEKLTSPVSVINFSYYNELSKVSEVIALNQDQLQCIVSNNYPAAIPFGTAQQPALNDYADGVDTLEFLTKI